ncbi:MAG: hypothetical protein HKP54_11580 [Boseongicola sp.]|nr:hypothetical protein [Boseongicola sp.]
MRAALAFGAAAIWAASAVQAEEGFPLTEREAKLEGCVQAARDMGAEVGICAGAVMGLCLDALTPEAAEGLEGFMCLQEEAFAWDNVTLRASHDYVTQIEGRSDIAHAPFVAEMGDRLAAETETCFDFPVGEEDKVLECKIFGAIERLEWIYALSEAARE